MYKYEEANHNRGGVPTKKEVLKLISQEEIYFLATGIQPEEGKYFCSPFREDNNPGCFFSYAQDNILYLCDYATNRKIKNIKLKYVNCFDAVILAKNLKNIAEALRYIYNTMCEDKVRNTVPELVRNTGTIFKSITPYVRCFEERDKKYWSQYYITSENLIQDKILPLKAYSFYHSKKGTFSSFVNNELAYCYCDFPSNNKKIYFPERTKTSNKNRFISTCTENDIGGLSLLPVIGNRLVITKSYKDWRVLKNNGLDTVWFQNEGCIPEELSKLAKRFDEIVIFYDNDLPGIEASSKLSGIIKSYDLCQVSEIKVPEGIRTVKDPADFIKHNIIDFKNFLKLVL
jgi:hypothetical protein